MTSSDKFLKPYIEIYGDALEVVPSLYYVWLQAQKFVAKNDQKEIKRYENLIFLLFNSAVSPLVRLGRNVKFSYGGIGTVIHKDAVIGDGVSIGQGVTIGGTPGKMGKKEGGEKFVVPHVCDNVYIGAGVRVLGGVEVGRFSVIGVNSVVISDVDQFSVYAGQPARKIKSITKKNCIKYKSFFHGVKEMDRDEYVMLFPDAID